jgi:hypothetical protein
VAVPSGPFRCARASLDIAGVTQKTAASTVSLHVALLSRLAQSITSIIVSVVDAGSVISVALVKAPLKEMS